jgi:ribosomal protein L37E
VTERTAHFGAREAAVCTPLCERCTHVPAIVRSQYCEATVR